MNQKKILIYEKKPESFSPSVEVSACYVNVGGKLLLLEIAHHKSEPLNWGVPAGKIDPDEDPLTCAKRELFEETGIDIQSEDSFKYLGEIYFSKPGFDYIYHAFAVDLDKQPTITLSAEHLSYKWVTLEEAEDLPLMNGAKEALDFYTFRHNPKRTN